MARNAGREINSGKQNVFNRWREDFSKLLHEDTEENTQECKEIFTAHQLIGCRSKEEVLQTVDKLRNSKASGPDVIPTELLKIREEELIMHGIQQ